MPSRIAGMPFRHWLRPPRNLLVLFFGTTISFLAGLVWLGWRSLEQDSNLEAQRVQTHLEKAAELIAAELSSHLADIEAQLERFVILPAPALADAMAAYAPRLGTDALVVAFDADSVQAYPRRRLLYYPILPAADAPYVRPLIGGRASERTSSDLEGQMEYFRLLAQADDERVRADATLGLARLQARAGELEAALATYRHLQQPEILVDGRPAEIIGRLAICELLDSLGRRAEYDQEIERLDQDLHAGRWQLTRAAYLHYAAEIQRLRRGPSPARDPPRPSAIALALATAVDAVWRQWEEGSSQEMAENRGSRVFNDQPVFLLWRSANGRLVTLVAGPDFLQRQVVEPVRSVLDRQGVLIALEDSQGQSVVSGQAVKRSQHDVVLTRADTRLPWMLRVVNANALVDEAQLTRSRQLVIAGLAFVGLFVVAGSYLSVRAMTREIEAVRLKSDFVAAVSHEFRTPLTLLRQFSDLLAEDRVSSEQERRRYYAALQRGTRRLTRLVEDLLDFGRMEAGSRVFKFERVPAREWLMSVTSEFQDEVRSKGYRLDVGWNGSPDAVMHADAGALGRALWNLLDNAVKYSPNASTIWATADVENGTLIVRVRDRGVGVPPDEQRAIFRKFVRGTASGAEVVKGTGLGLALVEQIVEAHRGTVHVESTVGEGSTFSMRLPVDVETDVQAQGQEQAPRKWRAS